MSQLVWFIRIFFHQTITEAAKLSGLKLDLRRCDKHDETYDSSQIK